jgi:superoxide dismutase, Cu-Zn family
MRLLTLCTLAIVALAACRPVAPARFDLLPGTASAEFRDTENRVVGNATLRQTTEGVLIRAVFTGLPAGTRSFHIHAVGACEPPGFQSAGGHYNPLAREHGFLNPRGPHAGDLPNLHVPEGGRLEVEVLAPGLTLGPGPTTLFDADGSALVIHEGVDDYRSDPTGNAGDRIACAVIRR